MSDIPLASLVGAPPRGSRAGLAEVADSRLAGASLAMQGAVLLPELPPAAVAHSSSLGRAAIGGHRSLAASVPGAGGPGLALGRDSRTAPVAAGQVEVLSGTLDGPPVAERDEVSGVPDIHIGALAAAVVEAPDSQAGPLAVVEGWDSRDAGRVVAVRDSRFAPVAAGQVEGMPDSRDGPPVVEQGELSKVRDIRIGALVVAGVGDSRDAARVGVARDIQAASVAGVKVELDGVPDAALLVVEASDSQDGQPAADEEALRGKDNHIGAPVVVEQRDSQDGPRAAEEENERLQVPDIHIGTLVAEGKVRDSQDGGRAAVEVVVMQDNQDWLLVVGVVESERWVVEAETDRPQPIA